MNKLLNSRAARAAAFVLTVALLMALCAGLVGVAALYSVDAYRIGAVDARDEMLSTWCWEQGYDVLADFVTQEDVLAHLQRLFAHIFRTKKRHNSTSMNTVSTVDMIWEKQVVACPGYF